MLASDLLERLPDGLRPPRCTGSRTSATTARACTWRRPVRGRCLGRRSVRGRRELLGRMAGRIDVSASEAAVGPRPDFIRLLVSQRVRLTLPMITGDDVWHHPAIAANVDPAVRPRLLALWERTPELPGSTRSPAAGVRSWRRLSAEPPGGRGRDRRRDRLGDRKRSPDRLGPGPTSSAGPIADIGPDELQAVLAVLVLRSWPDSGTKAARSTRRTCGWRSSPRWSCAARSPASRSSD